MMSSFARNDSSRSSPPRDNVENSEECSDQDFIDALGDLGRVKDDAFEDGYAIPSDMAISNAKTLLETIYRTYPQRLGVYPMPEGEVAIDVSGGHGSSALVLCESGGGVECSVNIFGIHRCVGYPGVNRLPDVFMRKVLGVLKHIDTERDAH